MNDSNTARAWVREIEPKGKRVLAAIDLTQEKTVLVNQKVRVLPQRTPYLIQRVSISTFESMSLRFE